MALSFYETSVKSYLQVLDGASGVLDKGASHAAEAGLDLQEMVLARLHDDMMPLHFQIVSLAHHSWGAIQGLQRGVFVPPSFELDMDYASLQAVVADARENIAKLDAGEIESLATSSTVLKIGKKEIPFTNENFLLSFSLPNFYFHATTTYDILRMLGVPLGKIDYLGAMRVGVEG